MISRRARRIALPALPWIADQRWRFMATRAGRWASIQRRRRHQRNQRHDNGLCLGEFCSLPRPQDLFIRKLAVRVRCPYCPHRDVNTANRFALMKAGPSPVKRADDGDPRSPHMLPYPGSLKLPALRPVSGIFFNSNRCIMQPRPAPAGY